MAKFLEVDDDPITKPQAVRSSMSQFSHLCKVLGIDTTALARPEIDSVLERGRNARTTKEVRIEVLEGLLEISRKNNDQELSSRIEAKLNKTKEVSFTKRLALAGEIVRDFRTKLGEMKSELEIPREIADKAGGIAAGLRYEDEIRKNVTGFVLDYLFSKNPTVAVDVARELGYNRS